jgi:hypothetical protein
VGYFAILRERGTLSPCRYEARAIGKETILRLSRDLQEGIQTMIDEANAEVDLANAELHAESNA